MKAILGGRLFLTLYAALVILAGKIPVHGALSGSDLRFTILEPSLVGDLEGRKKILLIGHDGKRQEYDIPQDPRKRTLWEILIAGQHDKFMTTHHRMVVRVYTRNTLYMFPMLELTGPVLGMALSPGDVVEIFPSSY
jgi:hypothetical protein